MLYVRQARGPIDDVCQRLESASAIHKFGVLGVHDLRQKMKQKGVDFAPECRVFEVCNPQAAKTVLEKNLLISTALPCRISVFEQDGKTMIGMLRPTELLALFGDESLAPVARQVEDAMLRIIDDACV